MLNQLVSHYDLKLVTISVVIAILAAYTALTFATHVTQTRVKDRNVWLGGGAVAMGTGIWAMHFVGMLAFQLPVAVSYNFPIVLFSMLAAVFASALALKTVTAPTLPIGAWLLSSVIMGTGISTMHYTGMAAMQLPAQIHYDGNLVSLSIGVAIVVSMIALQLVFRLCQAESNSLTKLGATIVMGAAIPLMHYIGMAAVHFSADTHRTIGAASNLDFLSNLVCLVTLIVLGGGLLISLEVQVNDRTASLARSNEQLIETLANLKQTQAMLAQSDKMSSIGEMVAGIAHEIKNPTSVLVGNMDYLKNYAKNLLDLLVLCDLEAGDLSPKIRAHLANIDQEFVLEDYPKVVRAIDVGIERVHEIVMTLRSFSRMESQETNMLPVDLRQSIESTLLLLRHRLKISSIEVIQDYGHVPYVECLPGQLNQVLLNIIGNAIDALESRDAGRSAEDKQLIPSVISIRIDRVDDTAIIYITDNGPGMSAEVGSHIFDAFYTTKSADKGTGLGLSISHQIITERHKGQLICVSEPGQGCEFQIHLPLQQRGERAAIEPADAQLALN
jgi:NO-binding membrane sensor protein with MHYT domain/nitrogen-specific signal transduction histidine kinase